MWKYSQSIWALYYPEPKSIREIGICRSLYISVFVSFSDWRIIRTSENVGIEQSSIWKRKLVSYAVHNPPYYRAKTIGNSCDPMAWLSVAAILGRKKIREIEISSKIHLYSSSHSFGSSLSWPPFIEVQCGWTAWYSPFQLFWAVCRWACEPPLLSCLLEQSRS